MSTRTRTPILIAVLVSSIPLVAVADEEPVSGFLSDYSILVPVSEERPGDRYYIAPGTMDKIANLHSVFIEQPEIYVHPESPYKGMKPDHMKVLADSYAEFVAAALKEGEEWPGDFSYEVVDEPGPGVLHLRVAIGNLFLNKQRSKNPLSYMPIGATVRLARNALTKDLARKVSLVEVTLELEALDSQTGEVLGAGIWRRGSRKDREARQKADPATWEELEAIMLESGRRANCRLNNARLPEEQWVDCMELVRRKRE